MNTETGVPVSSPSPQTSDFWKPRKPLAELAAEQGVKPWTAETIAEMRELANELWPSDADVDEFIAWVREIRREGGQAKEAP
jgi:hypothetical protein